MKSDPSTEDDKWHKDGAPLLDFDSTLVLGTGATFTSVKNKKAVTNL